MALRVVVLLLAVCCLFSASALTTHKTAAYPGGELTLSPRSSSIAIRAQIAYFEITVKDSRGLLVPNQEVRLSLQPATGGLILKSLAISPGTVIGIPSATEATAATDPSGVVGVSIEIDPKTVAGPRNLLKLTASANLKSSDGSTQPALTVSAQLTILPQEALLSDWQKQFNARLLTDFPWLARFKEADLKLGAPAAGENRVVFMGDSITEGWHFDGPDGAFPGKPYINRGISGQTTPQMLVRFRQDVIALQPQVVVILAGINDIAGNTGPMTPEQTEDNLASMAELAAAHHIRVVLCSLLPAFDFPWRPGMTPAPKVLALNAWIKAYAAEKGHVYVDFHAAMKDSRDGLPAALSADGVHPLAAGYAVMGPLVEAGIAQALGQ